MYSDFPFPLNHLQPKALEQLVNLPLLMFSLHQSTKDKRAKLFGSIKQKSGRITRKTENKRSHKYIVFLNAKSINLSNTHF